MDIKLAQDERGIFDFIIDEDAKDLSTAEDMTSAIYVSLMTDARANADQVAIAEQRRGWVGNVASRVSGRQLGGLLWLVEQRRLTQQTLNEVVDYARQALRWMTEDGIATKILVSGEIIPKRGIQLLIQIFAQNGTVSSQYVPLWRATINAN